VCSFHLCKVLLYDDSNYPAWLVLVPQVPDVFVRAPPRFQVCERWEPGSLTGALSRTVPRQSRCRASVVPCARVSSC